MNQPNTCLDLMVPPTVRIKITRGLFATISEVDAPEIMRYKWQATKPTTKNCYAVRWSSGSHKSRKLIFMHKSILGTDKMGDHRNGDTLLNTRPNLRIASAGQNSRNRVKMPRNGPASSKYKGVSYRPRPGRTLFWRMSIYVDGDVKCDRYFKTEIEAALAYNAMAVKHHGEFAHLNVIERVAVTALSTQ